jgi:hypothetical protein
MTRPVADEQGSLPGLTNLPEGFQYRPDFIDPATERSLIGELQKLDFTPFQFHGFEGKRRVVSFGWRYDFNGGGLKRTDDFPPFLVPIRDAAAAAFGLEGSSLEQSLLIEYGRVHRMAQGPPRIRRRHRDLAPVALHLQVSPEGRSQVGAPGDHGRTTLCLPPAGSISR